MLQIRGGILKLHKKSIISSDRHENRHTVKKLNIALLKQPGNGYLRCVALFIFICLVFGIQIIQISLLSGCSSEGNQSSPEHQSSEEEGQSDKIPESLKEMEENIEKIIGILDGPVVTPFEGKKMMNTQDSENNEGGTMAKKPGQQETQDKNKNGNSSQGESNGNTNNGQDKQDNQDNQKNQENQGKGNGTNSEDNQNMQHKQNTNDDIQGADSWEEITSVINKMHYTWNSYLPEALKMGTNQKTIDDFSNALNSLTNTIISKNKSNTLMAANSLYAYIPDLFTNYKTGAPAEIKRLRYYARNATLNSLAANWNQAEADVGNLISTWSILKNIVNEEQQETKSKLDYSILELEKVVKEKNQPLSDIKGRITLSNIMELEESFPS
jgi:hypothetical protein